MYITSYACATFIDYISDRVYIISKLIYATFISVTARYSVIRWSMVNFCDYTINLGINYSILHNKIPCSSNVYKKTTTKTAIFKFLRRRGYSTSRPSSRPPSLSVIQFHSVKLSVKLSEQITCDMCDLQSREPHYLTVSRERTFKQCL